ncbi:MAG: hypothetical protein EOP06_19980 [Proteobacteria bacterium]|nr:MAG: hypothetical protein EOP06_19980 [Pseudomonadota bacterium]
MCKLSTKKDKIKPITVGNRDVVGIVREAKLLGITVEDYFTKWKDGIKNSALSSALKTSVMSHIDYNSYSGLGVIVISVLPQTELSFVGDDVYWRNGDSTEIAKSAKTIATLAQRFK